MWSSCALLALVLAWSPGDRPGTNELPWETEEPAIEARLLDPDRSPCANAEIEVEVFLDTGPSTTSRSARAKTDESGRFRMALPVDLFDPEGRRLLEVRYAGGRVRADISRIPPYIRLPLDLHDLVLRAAGSSLPLHEMTQSELRSMPEEDLFRAFDRARKNYQEYGSGLGDAEEDVAGGAIDPDVQAETVARLRALRSLFDVTVLE